ncbi:hypothetical protein J7J81_03445 [bacterium]|nr:hypothetical protein [bacterium]
MPNIEKGSFYNPTLGKISFARVCQEILNYMLEKPDRFYEVVVGCDSSSEETPSFPVAIVVLRVGEGGRFFLRKIIRFNKGKKVFHNFHQRILQEILLSCEIGLSLREKLTEKINSSHKELNYQFRYIHADIGENGPTRDMIKEVIGLIQSNGFEAKIKPESFAASIVADRFT